MVKTPSWADYYARTSTLLSPQKTKVFLDALPADATMLDFGCGAGAWAASFMRDRPDLTIDVLDQHLDQAPLIGSDWRGARYHQSFETFKPDKSYDGIWSRAALFFIPQDSFLRVLKILAAALKPSGVFFFDIVDPDYHPEFFGLRPEELAQALTQEGLVMDSLVTHTAVYGKKKLAVPTHFIKARKKP